MALPSAVESAAWVFARACVSYWSGQRMYGRTRGLWEAGIASYRQDRRRAAQLWRELVGHAPTAEARAEAVEYLRQAVAEVSAPWRRP